MLKKNEKSSSSDLSITNLLTSIAQGSDALFRYTDTYTWCANQMAHVGLGLLLGLLAGIFFHCIGGNPWFGLLAILIPLFKDSRDSREAKAYELADPKLSVLFDSQEIRSDGWVDTFFWVAGIFLSTLIFVLYCRTYLPCLWIATLLGLLVAASLISKPYVERKRSIDKSQVPYYQRLVTHPLVLEMACNSAPDNPLQAIAAFIRQDTDSPSHLLLRGGPVQGKTRMALGIAGEFCVRKRGKSYTKVLYISADKLYQLCDRGLQARETEEESTAPWSFGEVQVLIIDDVNANKLKTQFTDHGSDKTKPTFPEIVSMLDKLKEMKDDRLPQTVWVYDQQGEEQGWETYFRQLLLEKDSGRKVALARLPD